MDEVKKKSLLSVREEELMNYLWRYDEALTSNEMAKQPELQGWNRATLLKTVQSLTDAGYLEVAGLEKSVKAYARKLAPSLTKEEYYSSMLMKMGISSDSLADITAALIGASRKKKKQKNDEVIAKLEDIIAGLRTENIGDE